MADSDEIGKKKKATVAMLNTAYNLLRDLGEDVQSFCKKASSLNVVEFQSAQPFFAMHSQADVALQGSFDGPWKVDEETGRIIFGGAGATNFTKYELDLNQEPVISGTSDLSGFENITGLNKRNNEAEIIEIDSQNKEEVLGNVAHAEDLSAETDMSLLASQINKRSAPAEFDTSTSKMSKGSAAEED